MFRCELTKNEEVSTLAVKIRFVFCMNAFLLQMAFIPDLNEYRL